jgi:inorganic triphosphatase YgiF
MTGREVPSEIEVKLEAATADDLRLIAGLRTLGRFRLRGRGVQQLHSVYLDTRDHALTRAGIALRVRRHGRAWEATAKWSGQRNGVLHERPELTVELPKEPSMPFKVPDGPLRTQLAAVVLGRRLSPILISDVRRQLRDLTPAEEAIGDTLAEVALDTVQLHAPNGAASGATYHEVEIERRGGETRDLTAASRLLQERFGLIPSRASKFARGYAALYGAESLANRVADVAASDSVAIAARKVVTAQLARIRAADPGVRLGRAPEPVHEARVAARRLRAALRTFGEGFPPRLRQTLPDELRWIGQQLGAVRDLDVQLANVAWHAARRAPSGREPLEAFRHHLESERAVRRAELIASLDSPRYFRLLATLERFGASPEPRRRGADAVQPVAAVGRRAVKRVLRKMLKRGNEIGELPEAEALHDLRKRAKRLRYLLEALEPISGSPAKKLRKKLVRLQDMLGRFNDAMVAATFVRAYRDRPAAAGDDDQRRPLSALADGELRRAGAAQAEFHRAWRRFTGKATMRRRRKLLDDLAEAAQKRPADSIATRTAPMSEIVDR